MVDQEPHRSVQLIRRVDTRIPTPLLSASLPSPSPAVLGKLTDLRAPKPVSSMTSGSGVWAKPQPRIADAGGRWTAVVTRPGSGSGSSSPAPGASSSLGAQVSTAALSLKPSGGAWVSSSVQRAREAASLERGGEEEAVPDDWEDDE
jgi:transcriptional repressor NF-X1